MNRHVGAADGRTQVGLILVTVGGGTYVKEGPPVEVPPTSRDHHFIRAAAVADVVAVISVSESTTTEVAALPIVTVAPATKPVPLIVTVRAAGGRARGRVMLVTCGGGT